jgi:hypothetical protein
VAVLGNLARFSGADFIQRLIHLGDDLEAVEDVRRMGTFLADHVQVGLPLAEQTNSICAASGSPMTVKNPWKDSMVRSLPTQGKRVSPWSIWYTSVKYLWPLAYWFSSTPMARIDASVRCSRRQPTTDSTPSHNLVEEVGNASAVSFRASVISFVAEEFPKELSDKPAAVIVLDCQRPFWEKVTLLHAENHRPDPSKLKPRMSRHWSDVAVMSVSNRFVNEKLSLDLLRTVIRFKQIYFAANWAKYENAVPGTIRIVPNEQLRKVLRDDYVQMKEMKEMLPVDALTFDQILKKLDALEIRLNALAAIAR